MGKFTQDATKLLEYVGGKENISAVTHCVTRMRFVLVDPSKADVKKIEALPSTKGTFTQAGQFQVIIGNEVAAYYDDFVAVSGIEGVSKDAAKQAAKGNQNALEKVMSNIAEIFAPLIPAIVCGGLILGFRNILEISVNLQQGTFLQGLDKFLWLIGEAVFHTGIPVGICWSVQKKMGGTQMFGIVLGLTLVSGQLVNAYGVAGMAADAWYPDYVWDFGFTQVRMIGYQAQVIPAILAAFTLAYLERFFKKIIPNVVQMILVPFLSITLAVMASHFILGPIGWKIGEGVSYVVQAGISGRFRVLFGALFGFFYAPLVITGLHHMSNAIDLQLIADGQKMNPVQGTMLWPMIALSNIAQGAAVLGMSVLQKKNERAQEVNIPSMISCWLGVTEPAMFGVNLKYKFPFYSAMVGSSIAGIISTSFRVQASAIGVGGLPGILSIMPQYMLIWALAAVEAIVVPFLLTYTIGRKKFDPETGELYEEEAEAIEDEANAVVEAPAEVQYTEAEKNEKFAAPVTGRIVKIEDVPDQVFASKTMGDGFAIDPSEGKLYSPFTGEVTVAYPTGHAYGLRTAGGKEVLIHIGMDTVELNGKGFKPAVKQGDHVKQGDLLTEIDLDYIKKAGKPVITPIIFTDGTQVELTKTGNVKHGDTDVLKLK
ncbi:MAG: PTS system trehalose-specific EIIBC component [Solobacterium sp.]|jgi:PTS system trehalose-specific IIC component|nr:PTS system trehalose-specific EIIBC component [Solobacterium sp.]MCH4048803.1 PTS system trehalose-specific EIIBC component [Solobacterium sp.]MCH4074443.1 PTS system trehalose-specific EIIBC component [Solobacterium sp.]MCI1314045.1 PTS system trehalose-specific EIIBC component [Solobacterium sp.]MCI1346129.1 PTS system trehalose-specific EIIBC component [Solobacterium sp.]